jgi:sugar phosphate isomerase/epimerase
MTFSLSTHWNAERHDDGEAMLAEAAALGFDRVELGYTLRPYLVPGVRRAVESGTMRVTTVHNFCPVPASATRGHPELYTLGSLNQAEHEAAVRGTAATIRFAAELGANVVVSHCGNIDISPISPKLVRLCFDGKRYTNGYERLKHKLMIRRERRAGGQFDNLCRGIEALLPVLDDSGVRLGLENLPTYEALPTEDELVRLFDRFGNQHICYWHDIGHGQIRENLGFSNQGRVLQVLGPALGGMHVHDVIGPAGDHVMPPSGTVDFRALRAVAAAAEHRVLEPGPRIAPDAVAQGLSWLRREWGETA